MDDWKNFAKLKYEQEKVLKDNHDAQQSREKIKDDYLKLQTKLQTLPDVISEDVMVPIGNVGFFPGHLIHTNEIMVLLGDNWFVERSAKQSIEIVERRIKLVEKQLSDLQQEESIIKSQNQYTNEFLDIHNEVGGIKEIQEKIPGDSLPKTNGNSRKAHVAKHNSIPRSVKFKDSDDLVEDIVGDTSKSISDTIDHVELFARLNELEKEEQEEEDRIHAEQMKEILSGKYMTASETNDIVKATYNNDMGTNHRHVKFKHDLRSCTSKSYDSDDEPMNVITFKHTPYPQRERSASESDLRKTINTPADVFEQFAAKSLQDTAEKPLKSILKKDSRSNSNENLKLRPILKTSPDHQPGTPELSFDDRRPILKTPPDSQGSDRRPGTPEYMLHEDPKSILKCNNGNLHNGAVDVDSIDRKPILKFLDTQVDSTCEIVCDANGEETRSILKTCSENKTMEQATTVEENLGGTKQENRKTILKCQENFRAIKLTNETLERRPILKNNVINAISDRVVERENSCLATDTPPPKTFSDGKPISKFKMSRSRK